MSLIESACKQASILIVEDDAASLREFADTVRDFGYEHVHPAPTADKALGLTAAVRPDLALVDIRLQGTMAGIGLAADLRRLYNVPVIFITAYGDDETLDEANAAEPYAFLLKPVSDRELRQAIRIALRLSRAEADLRESNRQLQHSRNQWQNTLRDLPGLVFARQVDGSIGFWNHACQDLLGYDIEDISQGGYQLKEIFGGELPFDEEIRSNNLLFDNRVYTMRPRNGGERQVRWTGVSSQPQITGWSEIYYGIDLTIEMRIRTELWHTSFRYLQLVETIQQGIGELDHEAYFTFANQPFYELLELNESDVLQKDLHSALESERFAELHQTIKSGIENKKPTLHRESVYCRDKEGNPLYLDVSIARNNPESDQSQSTVIVLTDVTKAEIAHQQVQKSEKRYRIISELSSDFSYSYKITPDGKNIVLWATDAIETVTGYTRSEFNEKGDIHFLLAREEDREKLTRHRHELLKGKTTGGTLRIKRKNGELRWLAIQNYPQYSKLDRTLIVIGAARDITDSKQANEDIARLSQFIIQSQETEQRRMAFELHDNVAQDLAALHIAWGLISNDVKSITDESTAKNANRFSELLTRCIRTVRNLSHDLSPAGIEEQSIDTIINEFADEFENLHKIEIHTQFAGIDGLELSEEIKINLFRITQESLNNIRQHANASVVEIKVITTPRLLVLDIRDDGCGFEIDPARKRALQTRHMGLFSIQQRASLIGGKAIIRSSPGQGARIRIEIPLRKGLTNEQNL